MVGFVIFVPMRDEDSEASANQRMSATHDDRIVHWWDETREIDQPLSATLGLHGPAWDIYLLYGAGTVWSEELPPTPHFWMHQLPAEQDTYPDGYLDPVRLELEVQQLITNLQEGTPTNANNSNDHLS